MSRIAILGAMSTAWVGGSTRAWRALRRVVLERDGYRCMLALPGTWRVRGGGVRQCMGRADCVHHVVGRDVSGDDPLYMVAACTPCNLKLGDVRTLDPLPRTMTQW